MKRQYLLLVTTFLLAITICGAATAADTNETTTDSQVKNTPATESTNSNVDNSVIDTETPVQSQGSEDSEGGSEEGQGSTNSDSNNSVTSSNAAYGEASTIIKVLIYNGEYASSNCVNGMISDLNYANAHNVVPGVIFSYATSSVINASILSAYDLLAMPGGDSGGLYLQSSSISGSAIRDFVYSGKGYLGICAGAYAASNYVDGRYSG